MKKIATALLLSFSMLFSQPAKGEIHSISSSLSITGTTASCTATIEAPAQDICAALELWCGNERLAVWYSKGRSALTFQKQTEIPDAYSCWVTVRGTIGGIEFDPVTVIPPA